MTNLGYVLEYGKPVLTVMTKCDEVIPNPDGPDDLEPKSPAAVKSQQERCANELAAEAGLAALLVRPAPIATSVRLAHERGREPAMLEASGIPELLGIITNAAAKESRRIRLSNPIHSLRRAQGQVRHVITTLQGELAGVKERFGQAEGRMKNLEAVLESYLDDEMSAIETYKLEMKDRTREFADQVITAKNLPRLLVLSNERLTRELEEEFTRVVVMPDRLQSTINGIATRVGERIQRDIEREVREVLKDGSAPEADTANLKSTVSVGVNGAVLSVINMAITAAIPVLMKAMIGRIVAFIEKQVLKEALKQVLKMAAKFLAVIVTLLLSFRDIIGFRKKLAEIRQKMYDDLAGEIDKLDIAGPLRTELEACFIGSIQDLAAGLRFPEFVLAQNIELLKSLKRGICERLDALEREVGLTD
ncbi:MAG: hypothetical protein ABIK09_04925 [Pseudomonadota bacterium]